MYLFWWFVLSLAFLSISLEGINDHIASLLNRNRIVIIKINNSKYLFGEVGHDGPGDNTSIQKLAENILIIIDFIKILLTLIHKDLIISDIQTLVSGQNNGINRINDILLKNSNIGLFEIRDLSYEIYVHVLFGIVFLFLCWVLLLKLEKSLELSVLLYLDLEGDVFYVLFWYGYDVHLLIAGCFLFE